MKYAIYALVAVCLSTACTHYSEPILETMYEKGMLDNHDTIDPPALSSAELAPGYDREPARTEDRTCHFGVLTLNHAGWEEYVCAQSRQIADSPHAMTDVGVFQSFM